MLISFEFPDGKKFSVLSDSIPRSGDLINLKHVGLNCFDGDRRLYAAYEKVYGGRKMSVVNIEWFPNIEGALPVAKIHLILSE